MTENSPVPKPGSPGFTINNLFTEKAANWYFLIALLAFIVLKLPHLSIPFFWDESGVYGRMIFILSDDGLSMNPKAIDMWISRGHPLLYPNLIAGACKLFGETVTVAHAANFAIACGLIISIFFCIKKTFNSWIGLMASVLLMATPIFFTQSVFVLPEVALTFFLWWTTWAFIQKKYGLYILAGTAAVLTKEPAIIWVGALFAWDLLQIRKIKSWKVLLWSVPLGVFALFLYWQKQILGWYFFPYHAAGFDLSVTAVSGKARDYLFYLFNREGRVIWLAVMMISVIGLVLKKTGSSTLSMLKIPSRWYAFLLAAFIYLLFSSTTFYHQRYILPLYPPACIMIAYLAYHFVVFKNKRLALLFLGITNYVAFQFHSSEKFNYDSNMSYIRSVASTKKTVAYLLQHQMVPPGRFHATMPVDFAMMDHRLGYMPKDTAARWSVPVHPSTEYVIQVIPGTAIENPGNLQLELMDSWKDHDIQTNIFKVIIADTLHITPQ